MRMSICFKRVANDTNNLMELFKYFHDFYEI